jgi:hypothetical protein
MTGAGHTIVRCLDAERDLYARVFGIPGRTGTTNQISHDDHYEG